MFRVCSSNCRHFICSNTIHKEQLLSMWSNIRGFSSCEYESKYTQKEKDNILTVLNECDQDKLKLYAISQTRLKRIIAYRKMNGKFNNLSNVLHIEGFGVKFLEKFCDSVIQTDKANGANESDKVKTEPVKKMKGQVLSPTLSASKCCDLNSVTAFHISVNSVSWVSINRRDYTLTDWKIIDISGDEGKRTQLTDIMHRAWTIADAMPLTDIYVLESPPSTLRASGSDPNNPKIVTINLQKAQLSAMLIALLNVKKYQFNKQIIDKNEDAEEFSQSVHLLRSALPARLFGLIIGSEVVSVSNILEKIFSSQKDLQDAGTIKIGKDFCRYYHTQKDIDREMLGRALLLGITFIDICVHRNNKSIDLINSYKKNIKVT